MKNFFNLCSRLWLPLLFGIGVLASQGALAQVTQLSEYAFVSGTGSQYDMSSGATTLLGNNTDDGISGATNIGFTFNLGGSSYTQFKANSNGYMTVGTAGSSSGCCGYSLTSLPSWDRPAIAMFSEDLHNGADGFVAYKVFGSAPNRVLVVHWRTREYPGSGQSTHTTMQARLYEGSNKIELWYGATGLSTSYSGGIGVIVSSSNYASVNSGSVSYTSASYSNFPSENTMYSFIPCQPNVAFTGNTSQGGTAKMNNGDTLLVNSTVMRGSAGTFQPFSLYNGTKAIAACSPRTYSFSISGANASDYSISPTSGSLGLNGTATPTITFRPGALGLRKAILTVRDDAGLSVDYNLHASGSTRLEWDGNLSEGGTDLVLSGDTLINAIQVEFGKSRTFTPLIISDISKDPLETPPAQITYTLNDPIGNYSISPTSTSITGGQQAIPQITFNAQGIVGIQEATLTVVADGEARTYLLRAYNAAPGGRLIADISGEIAKDNPLFVDQRGCVGNEVVSIRITADNTGAGDFIIRGADIFSTDTVIGPGTPPYPILRDQKGNPIPATDYFLSKTPGVSPRVQNQQFDSIVVPEKGSSVFYINLLPTRPGKRYGAIFFHTNAFNMEDENIDGVPTRGTLRSSVFGRGLGSDIDAPKAINFPPTEVRDTAIARAVVRNNGECDLFIRKDQLKIVAGDLSEFEILSALPNTPQSGTGYSMAPGMEDTITVRFVPNTYGSRRATIRLATNDSTVGDGQITEVGTYYLDLFGRGKTGIEARPAKFAPAVIDGESSFGSVFVENTSGGNTVIRSITINGVTTEFTPDPSRPWPTFPLVVRPAESLNLWVKLTGDATVGAGNRTSEMVIALESGDTVRVPLVGYVGTRTVAVFPSTLFSGLQLQAGEIRRAVVTVTNTGSLPVRMNQPVLASANPGDYEVGPMARRVLEAGQTEFIEVYYTPQTPGMSSGTITFSGNGTNGDQIVTLGGEGLSIGQPVDPSGSSTRSTEGQGGSKVSGDASLSISPITPNPARENATMTYSLAGEGEIMIGLYDASGRMVSTLAEGIGTEGAHSLQIDLSTLSSGTYHIRLRQGESVVTRTITVVK